MTKVISSSIELAAARPEKLSSYDKLSRWYDLLSGPFESRWRDLALRGLKLAAGERVLEIGCGTGSALIGLADSVGTEGQVFGVDLSAGMCQVAHARIAKSGQPRAVVIRADATALPFAHGDFSAVFMSFTLETFSFEEAALLLAQCHRVLGAGGRLGVVAMHRQARKNLIARLYDWAGRRFPEWVDCHPIPVPETLAENGFRPTETIKGSIGGLPVAIVIAERDDQAHQTGALTIPA